MSVLESRPDVERNIKSWVTGLTSILTFAIVLFWFVFLSRLRWRIRLLTLLLLGLAVYGVTRLVRVDGASDGRGLPLLVWRWSPRREVVLPQPATNLQVTAASATDGWSNDPQFLGPDRNGIFADPGLATDWSTSPPRELWRQPIGTGWSAFVVAGGRAFTQEQRNADECVTCYDAMSGQLLWAHTNHTRFEQWQAGEGPHATPTLHGDRVYAYGATGTLDCLDAATGAAIWSRNILEENHVQNLEWGTSASPLLWEDLVIVTGGNAPGPTVLAFDRASGEPRWKGGTDKASYSSPAITTLAGRQVILSFNAATLMALDPTNGVVLLEEKWGSDKPPKASQPVPLDHDRLFVTAGYGMGCELFQVQTADNGHLSVRSLWKNLRMKAQFNTITPRATCLYGLDDGQLCCLDVTTGQRRWKEGRFGSGQTLLVGGLILIQSEPGDVVLGRVDPEGFQELGRLHALTSKTWNYPALAGRYLLVRNDREAACYELPLTQPESKPAPRE